MLKLMNAHVSIDVVGNIILQVVVVSWCVCVCVGGGGDPSLRYDGSCACDRYSDRHKISKQDSTASHHSTHERQQWNVST